MKAQNSQHIQVWLVCLVLAVGLTLLSHPERTEAAQADLDLAKARYSVIMTGSRLDACTLCHASGSYATNPYGADYLAYRRNAAALAAIEGLDSDGDGYSNLVEINALTFPGNAADHPGPASTATPTPLPGATPVATAVPTTVPTARPTPRGGVFRPSSRWSAAYGVSSEGWTSQGAFPRLLADVNGDGRADVVGFGNLGVYVALSKGTTLGSAAKWSRGWGLDPSAGGWCSQDQYPRLLADVNGDGRADVVGFGGAGVYVSLSSGNGLGPLTLWSRSFGASAAAGGWSSQDAYPRWLADVNADGKADVVGFGGTGVYVALSTGRGFGPMAVWTSEFGIASAPVAWTSQGLFPRWLADVNGDGRADIVGQGSEGIYVALSTGSGFAPATLWSREFASTAESGWSGQDLYPCMLGDVNSDGKADLVGFGNDGVYVAFSAGTGFEPMILGSIEFGASERAGNWAPQNLYPRALADVNGGGRADIVGFGDNGVYVSLAN